MPLASLTATLFSMILKQHAHQATVSILCQLILWEAKWKCCGLTSWLAMDDYPLVISVHSKMVDITCTTGIPFALYFLGQTK